ncbi:hypothetical protein GMORB2_1921 [Geosmithia morbida]|uniref:Uncharacterized protein n=1 Tax=Geosmithia morbida TaxID=1094350 RepID=A0A9P4YV08_9HYPO|nr:uncharacterized protein GMORB2_1921 [Geosmithia morbida]KAF4121514.1 hypothetical protein GMORB2_1921 [Geosmithia morbida]
MAAPALHARNTPLVASPILPMPPLHPRAVLIRYPSSCAEDRLGGGSSCPAAEVSVPRRFLWS